MVSYTLFETHYIDIILFLYFNHITPVAIFYANLSKIAL